MDTKQKKKKRSIQFSLISLSVVPTLLLGAILIVISSQTLMKGMTSEVSSALDVAAHSLTNTYSLVAPGDLKERNGDLYKGKILIEGDYTVVDALKESYGMEITLFYGDERRLTTIKDTEGNRLIGTKADEQTAYWVLERGRAYFSTHLSINGTDYFGYYIPVTNSDDSIVGMAFAGKTRADVMNSVRTSITQSVIVSIMVILAALLCCVVASQRIVEALHAIMDYLGHLASSDFSAKMPTSVLNRHDEIGDMGRYASRVSKSLKDMITTDPLTGIYNRRACKNHLVKLIELCNAKKENCISVAIGDIDFFKRINDSYGHECGDMVLVRVSEVFRKHLGDSGVVSRWGGEEFLLVMEMPLAQAEAKLQEILEEIRQIDFVYEDMHFKVRFTFGINGEIVDHTFDDIIKVADNYLYAGKENGRNRIISGTGNVILPDERG